MANMTRARRTSRKANARVVLNRQQLTKIGTGVAQGFGTIGRAFIESANPPDATPFGTGLVDTGGYLVYAGTKKVDGWSQRGGQPKKPRALRLGGQPTTITMAAGWPFPARFQWLGTVKQSAKPFGPNPSSVASKVAPAVKRGVQGIGVTG